VTVEDTDRIDNIGVSADGGTYRLLMTEERLFEDSDEQFRQLMDKINLYVEYLQLGEFYVRHPEARGKQLKVCLVCRNEPVGERFRNLLNAATALFAKYGAYFYIEVIPDELLGPTPN
jgi:hypothetical protein